jgi:predicted enzyme related to lactoylglutathione lyase
MTQTHGTVRWSELMTRDVGASRAWYERVCGWVFEASPMDGVDYHLALAHGRPVAGIVDLAQMEGMDGVPPHWFTYLEVDDLEAAVARAGEAGGRVVRPPFEVPDVGRIAIVEDAGGAVLGLMTSVSDWDLPDAANGALENLPV